jgi:hypothetical protein
MAENRVKAKKNVSEGLQLVVANLTSKVECKPGFIPKVKLPELQTYQQV